LHAACIAFDCFFAFLLQVVEVVASIMWFVRPRTNTCTASQLPTFICYAS
jgi:hypothetical protein